MSISLQLSRGTTFSDLPRTYGRSGNRPKIAFLLAPHTNEHGAVDPFRVALAEKLEPEGTRVVKLSILDLMERGWRLRKQVGSATEFDTNMIISAVLQLEDILIRARLIYKLLIKFSDSMVFEVHGQKRIAECDEFVSEYQVKRIGSTSFITVDNLVSDVFSIFDREHYDYLTKEGAKPSLVALLRGFDLNGAIKELKLLLEKLEPFNSRIGYIGVPGVRESMPINHPMFSHYHQGLTPLPVSNFEQSYCTNYINSIGFSDANVNAVLRLIRM